MKKNPLPQTNLGAVADVLADMQTQGIISDYAIGGGVAAIIHYQPIDTFDLDIFFFLTKPPGLILSMDEIFDYTRKLNFPFDGEFIQINGWLVQFVEASHNPLWIECLQKKVTRIIDNREIPVIDVEYLAAMWIQASRPKDLLKIVNFDEAEIMDAKILFDILERFELLIKWRAKQILFSDDYQF
jgi:hypothetical protein